MCARGIEHFKATVPVMELTPEGYVPTGEEQYIWKAADVTAFTSLLKLADFKFDAKLGSSAQQLRDDLAERRAKRMASRERRAVAEPTAIPPIDIQIGN